MSNNDTEKKNKSQVLWVPDYSAHLDSMKELLLRMPVKNKK